MKEKKKLPTEREHKKREVIVYTDEYLTRKERKEFRKTHPGKRLSFFLRYPNFPIFVSAVSLAVSIMALIVKIVNG